MIDIDRVIQEFHTQSQQRGANRNSKEFTLIDIVRILNDLRKEEKYIEWIPCSKQMPTKKGHYIVTERNYGLDYEAKRHKASTHEAWYNGSDWDLNSRVYEDLVSNIVAWIKITPYKEDQ